MDQGPQKWEGIESGREAVKGATTGLLLSEWTRVTRRMGIEGVRF